MLPQVLSSRLEKILGDDFASVMEAFSHERIWSFRINTLKSDGTDVFKEFEEKGIIIQSFAWLQGVYMFEKIHEYALKGTRAFYDGKIYLQSIASMLPVLALDVREWDTVLDICAAPGSKTTQMAMIMKNEGSIVAIEQNQIRYDKLMYNVNLQWATIIEWMKMDARKYFDESTTEFNKILLDAPCSAEGRIFLPNEKSYGFWTLENITKKAELQYELLSSAAKILRTGGTLVYSTCTLAPEENEWVITRILAEYPDLSLQDIELWLSDKPWWKHGITSFDGKEYPSDMTKTVRILSTVETEGFFIARLQKR